MDSFPLDNLIPFPLRAAWIGMARKGKTIRKMKPQEGGCNKTFYATPTEAARAVKNNPKVSQYPCEECEGWHNTSQNSYTSLHEAQGL